MWPLVWFNSSRARSAIKKALGAQANKLQLIPDKIHFALKSTTADDCTVSEGCSVQHNHLPHCKLQVNLAKMAMG